MRILRRFFKMFNSYDKKIIEQCQFYMGCLPIRMQIDLRKLKFLKNLHSTNYLLHSSPMCHLSNWMDSDFVNLKLKYGITDHMKPSKFTCIMYDAFQTSLAD